MRTPYLLDSNVVSAVCLYFLYGLMPGSYTECCLRGDYDSALRRAHPHLKDPGNGDGKKTPHDLMVDFIEAMPENFRHDNFDKWNGYEKLSVDDRKIFLNDLEKCRVNELITTGDDIVYQIMKDWIKHAGKRYEGENKWA